MIMKKKIASVAALLTHAMAQQTPVDLLPLPSSHGQEQTGQLPPISDLIGRLNQPFIQVAQNHHCLWAIAINNMTIPEQVRHDLYIMNSLCLTGYLTGDFVASFVAADRYILHPNYTSFMAVHQSYVQLRPLISGIVTGLNLPGISIRPVDHVQTLPPEMDVEQPEPQAFFTEAQRRYMLEHPNHTPEAIYNHWMQTGHLTEAQRKLGRGDRRFMNIQAQIMEFRDNQTQ